MLIEHQHPLNKSIMLSVLGAPNVGKSSLINYLVGTDLSIVTNKEQTTRNRFHCVFTVDRTEVILVDTPRLHKSSQELNKRMNQQAKEGSDGADINLLLLDLTKDLKRQLDNFVFHIGNNLKRTWVVFTKSDLIKGAEDLDFSNFLEAAKEVIPTIEKHFVLSSESGDGVHLLIGDICDAAPSSPHLYTRGQMSNKNMRFFVCEYIRKQAFELLKEEIPYEVAVVIEDYENVKKTDPESKIAAKISASILVNRPSQRAIVVGKGGEMIKEIGTRARQCVESLLGEQVSLNLHVKVSGKWFKNNFILEELGLPRAENSARVWRK